MGYTQKKTYLMIGFGVSSISDQVSVLEQNVKVVGYYSAIVDNGEFPCFLGHILSEKLMVIRQYVPNIMCKLSTVFTSEDLKSPLSFQGLLKLKMNENYELVKSYANGIFITQKVHPFIRNICICFDEYLWKENRNHRFLSG
jgi:oxygen-independent coproporphyrinogen III oxidase